MMLGNIVMMILVPDTKCVRPNDIFDSGIWEISKETFCGLSSWLFIQYFVLWVVYSCSVGCF